MSVIPRSSLKGLLRPLVSRSKLAHFALNYTSNLDNRFQRATIAATDGPDFYKRRLWRRYLTPDPAFQPIALGPEFQRHLETLQKDGYVAVEGFDETASRLRELLNSMGLSAYRRLDDVMDYVVDVGFVLPEIMRVLCHPELCGLLCNYYGRQAHYREHPTVNAMSAGAPGVDRSSSHVHCDGYRQITMMLLVNDITPSDTHLIYYRGTQEQPKINYERVAENAKQVEGREAILGTGRAGTVIVFDSGSGYHRGEYLAGQRVTLNEVVTTGWLPFKDPLRLDQDVMRIVRDQHPPHVNAMFARL
jgi:hypothetical protein